MSSPTNQPWREQTEIDLDSDDWMYEVLLKDEYQEYKNQEIRELNAR